jgi:RNA polymerase sigma-70 factor, ECF subfamily
MQVRAAGFVRSPQKSVLATGGSEACGRRCSAQAGRVKWKPMDLEDDGELMLRYARGDLRAFEALYQRHRNGLYRYLTRHTRNPESANDLFQEVWSKVIASRERYEPRAKFQTFLYRIAHNCFIDYCRRAAVRAEVSGDSEDDWQSALPAPDNDRPDARAEQAQVVARYKAALAELPAEQRDVFLLYEESGLSLEEIAVITAVGPETAKSRLRYAVSKLRHTLANTAEGAVGSAASAPPEPSAVAGTTALVSPSASDGVVPVTRGRG